MARLIDDPKVQRLVERQREQAVAQERRRIQSELKELGGQVDLAGSNSEFSAKTKRVAKSIVADARKIVRGAWKQ